MPFTAAAVQVVYRGKDLGWEGRGRRCQELDFGKADTVSGVSNVKQWPLFLCYTTAAWIRMMDANYA